MPILARVIVAYKNRIVMAETLDQGLKAIFSDKKNPAPAILRELENAGDDVEELLLPNGNEPTLSDEVLADDVSLESR